MRRREFIRFVGGAAAWPLGAHAQQPSMPVIGFLNGASPTELSARVAAFQNGLGGADPRRDQPDGRRARRGGEAAGGVRRRRRSSTRPRPTFLLQENTDREICEAAPLLDPGSSPGQALSPLGRGRRASARRVRGTIPSLGARPLTPTLSPTGRGSAPSARGALRLNCTSVGKSHDGLPTRKEINAI